MMEDGGWWQTAKHNDSHLPLAPPRDDARPSLAHEYYLSAITGDNGHNIERFELRFFFLHPKESTTDRAEKKPPPPPPPKKKRGAQLMPIISVSKMSVAPPGMTPPAPDAP